MNFRPAIPFIISFVLLVVGAFLVHQARYNTAQQTIAGDLGERLAEQIDKIEAELKVITPRIEAGKYAEESSYPYYVYQFQSLKYWSDHTFVPNYAAVADSFHLKLLRHGGSDYIALKHELRNGYVLVSIIPLYKKYNITNDYLHPQWNEHLFQHGGRVSILEPNAALGVPVCVGKECVLKINLVPEQSPYGDRSSLAGVMMIFLSLLYPIAALIKLLGRWRHIDLGFIILFVVLRCIRQAMIAFDFPNDFIASKLFDPQAFASSSLNGSLGDLLLNELALLVLCVFLFRHYPRLYLLNLQRKYAVAKWILPMLYSLMILFAVLFPLVVIQTLNNNSTIALDISHSLTFDGTRIAALSAILLAGISSFLFAHVFLRLLLNDRNLIRVVVGFAMAMAIFAAINTWSGQIYLSSMVLALGYTIVIGWTKFYSTLMKLRFATFGYLFVCIFFFSANAAYAIYHFSWQQKIENQFRFANEFLIDRDIFGEYLLQETAEKISKDVFVQTRIASPFLNRDAIRQKIRQFFLPAYFNKYDVEIYLFNGSGESLDNRNNVSFAELIRNNQGATRTAFGDVYYLNVTGGTVAQQYVVAVPVMRSNSLVGYVVLTLGLKRVIPQNVYPELLVDNRGQQIFREQELSYVVFSREGILYSAGDFNYEPFDKSMLGNVDIHTKGFTSDGYDHIAEEDDNGRVAVVSSPVISRAFMLSNFSFFLVLGLMLTLGFILIQGIVNYFSGDKLYFSARVQLYLNLAFFLPLIIVSISTLSLTNRFSQNQLHQEYLDKVRSFGDQLSIQISESLDSVDAPGINPKVAALSKLTNMDANVYDMYGSLIATSQPQIFENNILSGYINQSALEKVRRGDNAFARTEKVGQLTFFVAYAALKKPTSGERIGIVGIPFFRSASSLEKVQINIFVNILNTFATVFIALVILSYFVSEWLTFPLRFITQSLRRTSFSKTNQPLVWKADDEIGLMVREYNQMLYSLSESKAELERTQRERAWREIAQQVAHEIKNPLTPMKLTLQQLDRSFESGKNTEEKTRKAIASMLTQVDTLNEIASSFSSFAKMPEPVIERLELTSLVRRIVDLHRPSGDISLHLPARELYVMADEQLLGRTFSNIILNAFQAEIPGRSNKVIVNVVADQSECLISFQDHGKGIEPAIAERIFIPYFTTKRSGSGLGLAIAKQGIEHMKGKIWFETQPGQGTTFFIVLPVSQRA